jgi:hypothetical protein
MLQLIFPTNSVIIIPVLNYIYDVPKRHLWNVSTATTLQFGIFALEDNDA